MQQKKKGQKQQQIGNIWSSKQTLLRPDVTPWL